jgi:elongation factor P--beta-lysine ligase
VLLKPELQPILIREEVIKAVRAFFFDQGFHEVITPVLNNGLPFEANLFAFQTQWHTTHGTRDLFLTTSPESGLKKMLAKGLSNCFSIGKSFRNLEDSGEKHNPEFLMLEWYREEAEYEQIMEDAKVLVQFVKTWIDKYTNQPKHSSLKYQHQVIELNADWPKISLVELFRDAAGIELEEILDDTAMRTVAQQKGYAVEGATWVQLFDQIYLNEVEPFQPRSPHFLIDFPARISPLCQPKKTQPHLAERFEVFLFGVELGNGNTELTDAKRVRAHFEADRAVRLEKGEVAPPIDEAFLRALRTLQDQSKSYAGMGLGIDRLAMMMADVDNIKAVEPFWV